MPAVGNSRGRRGGGSVARPVLSLEGASGTLEASHPVPSRARQAASAQSSPCRATLQNACSPPWGHAHAELRESAVRVARPEPWQEERTSTRGAVLQGPQCWEPRRPHGRAARGLVLAAKTDQWLRGTGREESGSLGAAWAHRPQGTPSCPGTALSPGPRSGGSCGGGPPWTQVR